MGKPDGQGGEGPADIAAVLADEDLKLREIAKMYGNMSLGERIRKTLNGLSAPKDSGEYKFAKLQLQLSVGPIVAVLLPLGGICFLLSIQKDVNVRERTQQVEIQEVEDAPDVEETPETPEDIEFLDPVDVEIDGPTSDAPTEAAVEMTDAPVSPKPAEMNSVAQIESPISLKGILGSRNPGQRGTALNRWGVGDGDAYVMKALRWLKKNQNKDGSWGTNDGYRTSMTALSILTFLAHGETPNDSEEFGDTVNKALQFLIDEYDYSKRLFKYKDGNNYSHPMAVYALSEAYSMTRNPQVKEVAESATTRLVEGQYKNGSWAYNMRGPEVNKNYPVGDTSYAGWCAQAIKAAHTAELDVPGLDECYNKAKHGFDDLSHPEGGFGYNQPGRGGLSSVGALCMQLLGEYDNPKVLKAMELMKDATYDFEHWESQPWRGGSSPVYYWYYLTQAKFQVGGETFKSWNMKFYPELSKRQTVVPKDQSGYVDANGKPQEIGYWDSPSAKESVRPGDDKGNLDCTHWSKGKPKAGKTILNYRVMDTCLTSLQLMVYYRFLPASQAQNVPEAAKPKKVKSNEVKVGLRKKSRS